MPIPTSDTAKYDKRDRVAWVTLNRPDAMNALNTEMRGALAECFEEVTRDDDVLVAIVIGEGGRAFSAGHDLKERTQMDSQTGTSTERPEGQGPLGSHEVYECPKPVIAAIDGYALAGGLELANRCDIRIATEKSRLGMTEPTRGFTNILSVDTMETGFIPLGEATWMLLTGAHMTAQRAHDIGLIQALVPDRDALIAEAERVANLLKQCAPLALRALKAGLRLYHNPPTPPPGVRLLDHLRELNRPVQSLVENSEDWLEGPRAFAEKREPNWKGR